MSFSDDDLRRLKNNHFHTYPINKCRDCALFARLEAAEKFIEHEKTKGEIFSSWYVEWRKAAGK